MHHPQRSEKKGWELFLFQVDSISHICSLPLLCNGNGDDGNGDNGNGDDGNGDDDDGDDDGDDDDDEADGVFSSQQNLDLTFFYQRFDP